MFKIIRIQCYFFKGLEFLMETPIEIRLATIAETPLILQFIKELAKYEKLLLYLKM